MSEGAATTPSNANDASTRQFLAFLLLSVLIYLGVTLAVQIPKVDRSVERSYEQSIAASAALHAAQLDRYILDRELALRDIAENEYVTNALLINNQTSPAFLDFIDHALVLGEDVEISVLDVRGQHFYSELAAPKTYDWASPLIDSQASNVLQLDVSGAAPRFELAIPIYYGRGREGILVARLDAMASTIFDNLEALPETSGITYQIGDAIIRSERAAISRPVHASVALAHYPVELRYITSADLLDAEKTAQVLGFLVSTLLGAAMAFVLLFWAGRKIVLAPQQKLAESRAAIAKAVEGISRIDANGNYLSLNDAYANTLDYGATELCGKPWTLTVHPQDLPMLEEAYQAMLKLGTVTVEARAIKKSGTIFHLQITMISQYENDRFDGHHHFVKDITARKTAEDEREKLIGKLTASNEELERFAYICSHDLQEPVRMIRAFSEKLSEQLSGVIDDDERAQRYLHFLTDGAKRAQKMIEDILAYSRLDSDAVRPEEVDTNDIVRQAIETMRENLDEIGGDVSVAPLPELVGHKTQLYQLFQNLINNSLKYQTAGARPQVHVSAKDIGTHWEFAIRDNGIGIELRHQRQIFDIFRRLHRKDEYAGTGVGLSICKKIVERHGGTIRVESELGEGATFFFSILKSSDQELDHELAYQTG